MTVTAPLRTLMLAFALAGCATTDRAADRPVTEAELREHIAVLASDQFEGRKPGTPGDKRTTDYIVQAWAAAGLRPAGPQGWLQPVPLFDRAPGRAVLTLRGARSVAMPPEAVLGISGRASAEIGDSEVIEVDPAAPIRPEQVRGKVAVIRSASLMTGASRNSAGFAGARPAAVLLLVPSETWAASRTGLSRPTTRIARPDEPLQLFADAGRFDALRRQAGAGTLRLSGTVAMDVRAYTSPNVIGRIPGTGASGEAIAIIGHWDHLGAECRPQGAPDRICNGAVDNASGIAVMIEVAERLARGPRPRRDVLFIATTAEEAGLLGARHYVANPTVPLPKIVALLNIDTIAIGPRGLPVSAVNRGNTPIDPLIDAAARAQGRALDADLDANAFIQRQDGAAFTEAGVPAVMAGGSFADMPKLQAFLGSTYHGPDDELTDVLPLGGAAEDADLHVLLARALADPRRYPTPRRTPPPRP